MQRKYWDQLTRAGTLMKIASTLCKTVSNIARYTFAMRANLFQYAAIALAITFSLMAIALAEGTFAATQCPAGQFPAPASDASFGITQGCVNASLQQQLQGGCSFNPYPVIEQYKASGGVILTPQAGGGSSQLQDGINPVLACRLAQFLQYAQQSQGCRFTISSGYRSAQTQANTCNSICGKSSCQVSGGDRGDCGTPGNSCHQYGLAIDMTGSGTCMNWAHSFLGVKNTSTAGAQQFKIFFPISSDLVHIQCTEDTVGACSPSTKPCDGSASITPNLNYSAPPSSNPTTGITSAIQKLFAPQQQAAPAAQPAPAQAPTVTAAQPITAQPAVSATPVVTTGSSVLTAQTQPSLTSTAVATSALDLLESLANPVSATTSSAVGTSAALYLNAGAQDIGEIQTVVPAGTGTSSYGGTDIADAVTQQTFTSGDLANSPNSYEPQSGSTFSQILNALSAFLTGLLHYLQPFGGNVPSQNLSE
jgi:hypothetical protein